jgi:hypothetical protein
MQSGSMGISSSTSVIRGRPSAARARGWKRRFGPAKGPPDRVGRQAAKGRTAGARNDRLTPARSMAGRPIRALRGRPDATR